MAESEMPNESDAEMPAAESTLAAKLEHLFETIPNPATGKRYTNSAAAEAIEKLVAALPQEERVGRSISPQYIWQLRRGVKDNPTLKHLKSLAALFGVEPDVFLNDAAYSDLAGELSVIAAMRYSGVDQIAFRARGLSRAGLNAVLAALDHARAVEGLPVPDDGQPASQRTTE